MIIQCPACSTGFNLPDKHITTKGAKLRCSKCSYVFRVRRDSPDSDVEFFYKDEDLAANEALAAEQRAAAHQEQPSPAAEESDPIHDAGPEHTSIGIGPRSHEPLDASLGEDFDALLSGNAQDAAPKPRPIHEPAPAPMLTAKNRTQIGSPALSPSPSSSDLSGYGFGSKSAEAAPDDPFPLAGADLKSLRKKMRSADPEPASAPAAAAAPVTAAAPKIDDPEAELGTSPDAIDLFEGSLAEHKPSQDDFFGGAFQDSLDAESFAAELSSPQDVEEEASILRPGQPGMARNLASSSAASASPQPASPQPLRPSVDLEAPLGQDSLRSKSGVSGAFIDSGDLVDPSFGTEVPAFDPNQGVVEAAAPTPVRRAQAAAPRQIASGAVAASMPAPSLEPDTWPSQHDAIAAHRIGGGGVQKVANLTLILLLVTFGFFGLVAALNGGLLDFKQFGSMIEVAFSGGEYKPRPEWIPKEKPKPVAPSEAPLRTESVWAEVVPYSKKNSVLVVRGSLRNFDQQDYIDVQLRGIVFNAKEKILAEKTAPLGALISNATLKELSALDDAQALLPKTSPPLKVASAEPFTIIFDDIPMDVTEGEAVIFRVDVIHSVGKQDLARTD